MFVITSRPWPKGQLEKELKALRKVANKLLKSKTKARNFLIANGFITKSGKLTKRYRS